VVRTILYVQEGLALGHGVLMAHEINRLFEKVIIIESITIRPFKITTATGQNVIVTEGKSSYLNQFIIVHELL